VRYIATFLSVFCTWTFYAQQLRIGVFRDYAVKRISFAYNDGSYSVFADSIDFGAILSNEFVELSVENKKVSLKKGGVELGLFTDVYLIQNQPNTSLTLTPKFPVVKPRKYKDDFHITANGTAITIVNLVDTDNYLAGVVESEGGGGNQLQYYKVQALMSRTYAKKNLDRHKKEGFDLCDKTHCQAYFSMMRFTPAIDSAIAQTRDLVMIDEKGELIDAYFHANCGGQTCEPQLVWNEKIGYLATFIDTFCIYTKQSTWEKRVPKEKWAAFLVSKYNFPINDSVCATMAFTFSQQQRMGFYLHPVFGIPLRDLRDEFDLKSTFFSCYPEGEEVVIQGRGFGHGVGLCQEGAMKMAKSGFDFKQIARYYFPKVSIVEYTKEIYFHQKGAPSIKEGL
jgi:stage II sporulation protein D